MQFGRRPLMVRSPARNRTRVFILLDDQVTEWLRLVLRWDSQLSHHNRSLSLAKPQSPGDLRSDRVRGQRSTHMRTAQTSASRNFAKRSDTVQATGERSGHHSRRRPVDWRAGIGQVDRPGADRRGSRRTGHGVRDGRASGRCTLKWITLSSCLSTAATAEETLRWLGIDPRRAAGSETNLARDWLRHDSGADVSVLRAKQRKTGMPIAPSSAIASGSERHSHCKTRDESSSASSSVTTMFAFFGESCAATRSGVAERHRHVAARPRYGLSAGCAVSSCFAFSKSAWAFGESPFFIQAKPRL